MRQASCLKRLWVHLSAVCSCTHPSGICRLRLSCKGARRSRCLAIRSQAPFGICYDFTIQARDSDRHMRMCSASCGALEPASRRVDKASRQPKASFRHQQASNRLPATEEVEAASGRRELKRTVIPVWHGSGARQRGEEDSAWRAEKVMEGLLCCPETLRCNTSNTRTFLIAKHLGCTFPAV